MHKLSARANPKKSLKAKYKRIVLKLSGEALKARGSQDNISPEIVQQICHQIQEVHSMGVEVAVVIGGGNIWRGLSAHHRGMERTTADYMGMLATVINGLALQSALEQMGLPTRVQTAIKMDNVAEPFVRRRAIDQLENRNVVIFVAGTGNPFFSTDTTAALRANEIGAEVILKATKVDGIYTADPFKDPTAKKYDRITYAEALSKRLSVMDSTAFSLCQDNKMPIIVFDMMQSGNIKRVVLGKPVGTLVTWNNCDMDPDEILLETEASMEKGFEYMTHEFASVRTGKASPALVENIDVEAYGAQMKLKQLALITTPEPRLLVIQPFDASTTKDIEKAIKESKIGINPAVDGKIIRLPIPQLSEERRKDLVKGVKQMGEEARVRIRSARREGIDAIKKAQKDGLISEDDLGSYEKEVQKLTDQFVKKIDDALANKEADILKV